MKRTLLLAAVLTAPLYLRQRQVEREQREHRSVIEAEVDRLARECTATVEGMADIVGDRLEGWRKEISRELSRAGRP